MGKSTRCSPVRRAELTPSPPGHFMSTNQANADASRGMPKDRPISFKPEYHSPPMTTSSGFASTYTSDFSQSPPRSPTRAPRPRDNFHSNPAVPGTFETTNMLVNAVVDSAHRNGAVHRPSPFPKSDHGPLNAPTTGIDYSRTTYRSEFYTKPMTRGLSPNRRFVHSPVVRSPENRDFLTSTSSNFRTW